jgi:hypothetical protein
MRILKKGASASLPILERGVTAHGENLIQRAHL